MKKVGSRKLLAKEKKELFIGQDIFFGEGNGVGFIMQISFSSFGRWRETSSRLTQCCWLENFRLVD